MATTIVTKSGSGAPTASDLVAGELAVDLTNKRLYTEDSGGTVLELGTNPASDVTFGDNTKAIFGAGSDLQIYHDASHSYIVDAGTGNMYLSTNGNGIVMQASLSETMFAALPNGAVTLYHDNAAKLATTATGIDVTGSVTANPSGGVVTLGANGHITSKQSLDVATAGGRYIGSSNRGILGQIKIEQTATGADGGYIEFDTSPSGSTSPTTRMVIDSSGNTTFKTSAGHLSVEALGGGSVKLNSNGSMGMNVASGYSYEIDVGGSEVMRIDSSGRVGIGVVPSTIWSSSYDALQIGLGGSVYAHGGAGSNMQMAANSVYEGTAPNYYDKYLTSSTASKYVQDSGLHIWSTAASGTAGNAITWSEAMRIDTSGNVGIGTSTPAANITIDKGLGANSPTTFTTANSYLQLGVGDYNTSGAVYAIGFGYSGGATHSPAYIGFQQTETGSYTKGDLVFRTRSTSTDVEPPERMRLDASGNVGIGVVPLAHHYKSLEIGNTGSQITGRTAADTYFMSGLYWSGGSTIKYAVSSVPVGFYNITNGVHIWSNAPSGTAGNDATPTAAMVLDASGNLLVGVSTFANNTLGVAIRGASSGATDESIRCAVPSTSSTLQIGFYNSNGRVGSISTSGSATAFNTSSDQRLKENIADADDAGSKIDAIQVRKFDWKVDGSHQDYGMVAQELLEVAPEAVSGDSESDEMMGVDYSKLVPMMLKEIQSLRARIAALES